MRGGAEAEGRVPIGRACCPASPVAPRRPGCPWFCSVDRSVTLSSSVRSMLLSKHTCFGCSAFQAQGCTARAAKRIPSSIPGVCASPTPRAERLCLYPRFLPRVATCCYSSLTGPSWAVGFAPTRCPLQLSPTLHFHFSAFSIGVQWGKIYSLH